MPSEAGRIAAMALRKGTRRCPHDGNPLYWENIGGSRLYEVEGGMSYYKARCPKCMVPQYVRRGRYTDEDV